MLHRPSSDQPFLSLLLAGLLAVCCGVDAWAQNVSLKLSTGDRVSGNIISQTTNTLTISNAWASMLSIPLNQIVGQTTNHLDTPPMTGSADLLGLRDSEKKPAKPAAAGSVAKTNHWSGEVQVGLDLLYGATDRTILHGKIKLLYNRPYHSNPKKYFRNSLEFSADYGTAKATEDSGEDAVTGVISDRLYASDKTTFDIKDRWYLYDLVGGGYDHIQKIDSQYEAGPGVGYHLISRTNFTMNLEGGLNYQSQDRSDGTEMQDVYYRFAEDFTWKIAGKLSFTEKFEAFPRVNLTGFRMRFDSTLSYELWRNLSLNLTVLDLYDTEPAENVSNNELQIRSSVGVKF